MLRKPDYAVAIGVEVHIVEKELLVASCAFFRFHWRCLKSD